MKINRLNLILAAFIIVALSFIATKTCSAALPNGLYFRAIYIVKGNIANTTGQSLENKKVRFFVNTAFLPFSTVEGSINPNANGQYADNCTYVLNPYGGFYPTPVVARMLITPSASYWAYIPNDSTTGDLNDGWGADPALVNLSGKGIENVDLVYRKGGGNPNAGAIQGLSISREANGIVLSWQQITANNNRTSEVWRLAGSAKEFSTTEVWTLIANVKRALPIIIWKDFVPVTAGGSDYLQTGNGINAYYRVIPSGTIPNAVIGTASNDARIFDMLQSPVTVGKVDVVFPVGYTLFEVPVWGNDLSLQGTIGDQLPNKPVGDELYDYNMAKSVYSSGRWVGTKPNFEKGRGYYLRLFNNPKTLTFVGQVYKEDVRIALPISYSMVGNPYPVTMEVETAFKSVFPGDGSSSGDEIYDKLARKRTYTSTGWVGANYYFGIGEGFWFRRIKSEPYNWLLKFQ